MASNAKPQSKQPSSGGGFAASALALGLLWIATGIAVLAAYEVRPAAPVTLTLVASNVGFDVLGGSRSLLLSDADLTSFTVSGFDSLIQTLKNAGATTGTIQTTGVPSITVKPARLETVTAPGGAHVIVNWSSDEPESARIAVSRQPVHGSVRVPEAATITCHGCDPPIDAKGVAGFEWTGRASGGGTSMLVDRDLSSPLRLSQDDIAVEGALDTTALSADQRVSTIKEGSVQFLSVERTQTLTVASRLVVDQIEPGTGRLKDLSVAKDGIHVTLEAKAGKLGVLQAGGFDDLRPSWLELGFKQQSWLYFTQGLILVAGTATKLLAIFRKRGGGDA
jgi:hypothetical protein